MASVYPTGGSIFQQASFATPTRSYASRSGSNPIANIFECLVCCGVAAAATAGAQAGSGNCNRLSAFSWVLIIGGLGLAITGCLLLQDSNLWAIAIGAGIFVAAAGLGFCCTEQNRG